MKVKNIIEMNGKKYILTEVKEVKEELKSYINVSYEFLPGLVISHHFPVKTFKNINDGRYRLPNGSIVSIATEKVAEPTFANEYEVSLLKSFVTYIIKNKVHRCINQPKKKNVGKYVNEKKSRPFFNKAVLKIRPEYKTAIRMLKDGMSMRAVSIQTGLSYSTGYRINYSFCGYEPKHPYEKNNRCRPGRSRSYTNEWIADRYDNNLTIMENARKLGVSKNVICRFRKECGLINGDNVKCIRRRITLYERIDMKK